jgi:hypothetical protein
LRCKGISLAMCLSGSVVDFQVEAGKEFRQSGLAILQQAINGKVGQVVVIEGDLDGK